MMTDGLLFLVKSLLDISCVMFLGRFLIQASGADFYNPISQGVVKITDPICKPLRILLPSFRNLDFASFVMAWAMKVMVVVVAAQFGKQETFPSGVEVLVGSLYATLALILSVYWFALIVIVILSFLAPGNYHPAAMLLQQITEPLVAPVRRLIPPMGGLDFSVLVVFLLLVFIRDFFLPSLFAAFF